MKNFKVAIMTVLLTVMCNGFALAGGLGYVDYERVVETYPYAQTARKNLDSKAMALKQYMFDKEKEYESIQSPVQKQNFQDKVAAELKTKQTDFIREQARVEQDIFNKISEKSSKLLGENHSKSQVIALLKQKKTVFEDLMNIYKGLKPKEKDKFKATLNDVTQSLGPSLTNSSNKLKELVENIDKNQKQLNDYRLHESNYLRLIKEYNKEYNKYAASM